MKTFTQKLYIHEAQEWSLDEYFVASSDMTDNGYLLLGTEEVELPAFDLSTTDDSIKALCDKREVMEAKHHDRTCAIEDEIKRLEAEE